MKGHLFLAIGMFWLILPIPLISGAPISPAGEVLLDDWTIFLESDRSTTLLGSMLTPVGDFNGDGRTDLVVPSTMKQDRSISIHLLLGTNQSQLRKSSIEGGARSHDLGDRYGLRSVSGLGDINGDGFDDFGIGVVYNGLGIPESARQSVLIFFGYNTSGDIGLVPLEFGSKVGRSCNAFWFNHEIGTNVAPVGDINGDGYDDFLTFWDRRNVGTIVYGFGGEWPSCARSFSRYVRGPTGVGFGSSVLGVGDVDQDGFGDILFGTSKVIVHDMPRVFYASGSASGLSKLEDFNLADGVELEWRPPATRGVHLQDSCDYNGDGVQDLVASALRTDDPGARSEPWLFLGDANHTAPGRTSWSDGIRIDDHVSTQVWCIGDANGDGSDDLLLAWSTNEAFLLLGEAREVPLINVRQDAALRLSQIGTAEWTIAPGDYNGDGVADLAIGLGPTIHILYLRTGSSSESEDEGQTYESTIPPWHWEAGFLPLWLTVSVLLVALEPLFRRRGLS